MLASDLRVYLLSVLRIANAQVLPFDWRATTGEFSQTLARYQTAVGDAFDLSPAAAALGALEEALGRFQAALAAGRLGAGPANAVL